MDFEKKSDLLEVKEVKEGKEDQVIKAGIKAQEEKVATEMKKEEEKGSAGQEKKVLEVIEAEGVTITRYASFSLIAEELALLDLQEQEQLKEVARKEKALKEKNDQDHDQDDNEDESDQGFFDLGLLLEATFWLTDTKVDKGGSSFVPKPLHSNEVTTKVQHLKAIASCLLPAKLQHIQLEDDQDDSPMRHSYVIGSAPRPSSPRYKSAFVKAALTGASQSIDVPTGEFSRQWAFIANSAFIANAATGQVLKRRLADGAYFLSSSTITSAANEKKGNLGFGSRGGGGTAWNTEMECHFKITEKTVKSPVNAKDSSFLSAQLSVPVYENLRQNFSRCSVSQPAHAYRQAVTGHTSQLASMGVIVIEDSLAELLKAGILVLKHCKEEPDRLIPHLAAWLPLEKDLNLPVMPFNKKFV